MQIQASLSEILRHHYDLRQTKNLGYSVRAYARDLGLSPAFLSQLLTEKRGLSPDKADQIAKKLKLSIDDRDHLIAHSILSTSRSLTQKQAAHQEIERFQLARSMLAIKKEDFTAISEWYHLAIFQCLFLKFYPSRCKKIGESRFLSRFLKITKTEAELALQHLCEMNLVTFNGFYHRPISDTFMTQSEVPSAAIRKFHRQIIQKALTAMDAQPVSDRLFNTTTLTLRKADLPMIQKEYEKFYQRIIKQFSKKADAAVEADSIYALSSQLFSLSHEDNT